MPKLDSIYVLTSHHMDRLSYTYSILLQVMSLLNFSFRRLEARCGASGTLKYLHSRFEDAPTSLRSGIPLGLKF